MSGGSAGLPVTGVEVAYIAPDGTELRRPLPAVWAVPFEHALPGRAFASYRRQRNLPGLWWSATTGRHVGETSLDWIATR
ncbi:hypothetical protein [Streptomyces sp. NPDC058382]|uniref:hypothetical protein n=1 Tax=unclassified Streptomyces TaxID=2593676 RepID=UPI00362F68AF